MTQKEVLIGVLACIVALAGLAWGVIRFAVAAMASTVGGSQEHVPLTIFPLPVLAVGLAFLVLRSGYKRGKLRPCLWLVVPAGALSLFTILAALAGAIYVL